MGERKLYRETNLLVIFSIALMAVLGVASITPAFPMVAQELNIPAQDVGLLITAFTIPGVLLTPVLGVLADRWGRKKILIPSLMLFGVAGGACALARDFDLLLALRFLQGIGAASIASLNLTLIGDLYSGRGRASAMGYNASVLSIGTASYLAIGGALAMFGWNYPFILPLVAIPVGLLVMCCLKNPEPDNAQSIKLYLGGVWRSIKNRQAVVLFIAGTVTFIILYGSYMTYFPFLIANSFGASALVIGIVMASMSLSTALTASQMSRLVKTNSEKTLLNMAFILYTLALVIVPLVTNLWLMLIPTIIFGVAHGLNIPNLYTLLTGLAPTRHRAAFMSINGTVLKLGQTLGPVLMGAFFVVWGMSGVFYVGAGVAITMFLLLVALLK